MTTIPTPSEFKEEAIELLKTKLKNSLFENASKLLRGETITIQSHDAPIMCQWLREVGWKSKCRDQQFIDISIPK